MKEFNSTEFCSKVKNLKETMVNITYDSQVKNIFYQVIRDNDYNPTDVLNFLAEIWNKTYPNYADKFNSQKWSAVFNRFISAAEEEYDWELAKKLKDTMTSVSGKGKEREALLHDKFFGLMDELGIDTHLLKIDMSIDLFGWMATLDLVISMADGITEKKTLDETVSSDLEGTKLTSTITEVTKTDKVVEDKEKKTRKRTKWSGILQYSLDGKLVRQWKSITEAAKTLNLNHASISKCVNGTYKKAVGYRWEGIKEPMEDMTSTLPPDTRTYTHKKTTDRILSISVVLNIYLVV